ncbi:hypothetical protein [Streptomyces poriticola]|uniref:hypothetical protein n=1 Tax=Streptomyces poriticola TaxID=3120506 RepID=UPI002FCE1082
MTADQTPALTGTLVALGILALLVLPSLPGIVRDLRIDRQLGRAQEDRGKPERAQKSSSRSTVPSTATWYADGRRSKKLVSS